MLFTILLFAVAKPQSAPAPPVHVYPEAVVKIAQAIVEDHPPSNPDRALVESLYEYVSDLLESAGYRKNSAKSENLRVKLLAFYEPKVKIPKGLAGHILYGCSVKNMMDIMSAAEIGEARQYFLTTSGKMAFEAIIQDNARLCVRRWIDEILPQYDQDAYRIIGKPMPKRAVWID